MSRPIVRITEMSIQNFKNVVNGSLSLINTRKDYKASIVGIYGQNGSGKTSVIEVLSLLKNVLCGQPVPAEYADFINIDATEATRKLSIINSASRVLLTNQLIILLYQTRMFVD